MSRPVERWLGTFMCTQYADTFEAHGYKTLQSVCQLDFHQLQSMGVRPEHCEKIMENVSVLRQSYTGGGAASVGPKETMPTNPNAGHGGGGFNMTDRRPSSANYGASQMNMGLPQRMPEYPLTGQVAPTSRFQYNQNQMYSSPSYNSYVSNQMDSQIALENNQMWQKTDYSVQQPYSGQYNLNTGQYQSNQQRYSGQNRMYGGDVGLQGTNDALQNRHIQQPPNNQCSDGTHSSTAGSNSGPSMHSSMNSVQSSLAQNVCGGHMSVSQSPQQVADSILQMASSTYQTNASSNMGTRRYRHGYPSGSISSSQQHFTVPQPVGQFCYAGVGSPLSPIQVRSPASVQNSQCMTSSSPSPLRSPVGSAPEHCSMPSPVMTGIQSPVSNMRQQMCSPVQGNPPMSACSPVPHMNIAARPSPSPAQHGQATVLPPSSPMSQMNRNPHPSPSPLSQLKSPAHMPSVLSPEQSSGVNYMPDSSVQHSSRHLYHSDCYPSISSQPDYVNYASTSSPLHYTELQPKCQSSTSTTVSYGSQYSTKCMDNFNPLQSLQKLVMLPESQVVDPKSVVSDANMLSPEGSKYDESSLLADPQLSNINDQQLSSKNEQLCTDGKHCGTDVEDELDSKFLTLETNNSKDMNGEDVDVTIRKALTRKKRHKKGRTRADSLEVNPELGPCSKQKTLRRRGRQQQYESFEELIEAEQQISSPSKLNMLGHADGDPESPSGSVQVTCNESQSKEKSHSSTPHTKYSPSKDLKHFSETSIRHCTVELEDISPLKNGRTQLNGFSDYSLSDVKKLASGKLDNCQRKRSRDQGSCVNQNGVNLVDDSNLRLSPRAKRIRKRNQSLHVDGIPAAEVSPGKQNGIHEGTGSDYSLLSKDNSDDLLEKSKGSDKPRKWIKSLFNGRCTGKQGDFSDSSSEVSSLEKKDSVSNVHEKGPINSDIGVILTKTESVPVTCKDNVHESGDVAVEKDNLNLSVKHKQFSEAAPLSFHQTDSVDSITPVSKKNTNTDDDSIDGQDEQQLLFTKKCHEGTFKTSKQKSCYGEQHQDVFTDGVTNEKVVSYSGRVISTESSDIAKRKSENQDQNGEVDDMARHNNATPCDVMFSGCCLKGSVKTEKAADTKVLEDEEVKSAKTVIMTETADDHAHETRTENKNNAVDCKKATQSTKVEHVSEVHLNGNVPGSGEAKQETKSAESMLQSVGTIVHSDETRIQENTADCIVNLSSSLPPSASLKACSEHQDIDQFDSERSEVKMNGLIREVSANDVPVVKPVHSVQADSNRNSNTLNFESSICNGVSPTDSDSPTKASDKENPVKLDPCKGWRRRPLTLATKCLDYSSDESADFEETKVSTRKRPYGSRSLKLSCVENKKQNKNYLAVSLSTLSGVNDSASATIVKTNNSIIDCNSKPVILKEKSSLDLIVSRLNQHMVEKQVLTVAPVYVLGSQNSSTNACNHTSSGRILRNSSTKAFHSNSLTCNDNSVSKTVNLSDARTESKDDVKEEDQSLKDKCNTVVHCPPTITIESLGSDVTESTAGKTGGQIKAECTAKEPPGDCDGTSTNNEIVYSKMPQSVLSDVKMGHTQNESTSSADKTRNSCAVHKRSKSRKSKKRYRSFSEFGSEDEKLRKMFKIKSERKGKKDHLKTKQEFYLSRGPYVKLTGNRDLPESYEVVNLCHGDPDKQNKLLKGYSKPESHLDPGSEALMKMSSSSPWICVFCGRRSNEDGSGDLFGPYFLEISCSSPVPVKFRDQASAKACTSGESPCTVKNRVEKKISVSKNKCPKGKCDITTATMRKVKTASPPAKGNKKINSAVYSETGSLTEVWMHEDCVVWTSGVFAMGGKIHGLEEALYVAKHSFCSMCKNNGATLGCFQKGCNQKYHYFCALNTDCYMDEENFTLLCQRHKEKRLKLAATENR